MKPIFLILVFILFLCSCKPEVKEVPVAYRSTFPLDTSITVEKIPMKSANIPYNVFKLGDRVIVAQDYGLKSIYSYPEMQFLGEQTLNYHGMNNDENRMYCSIDNRVDVYSLVSGDSLQKVSSYSLKQSIGFVTLSFFNEKKCIYEDNYEHAGLHEFHFVDLVSGKETASGGSYPEGPDRFKSTKNFKTSYAHGISVKPNKSLFSVFYCLNRRVRIYDSDGNLRHDTFLDYPPGNNKVINLKCMYEHFSWIQTTDSYIYLLCPEQLLGVSLKPECYIVVMDWEGNLVARYHLQNCFAYSFFVDESKGILFGGAYCVPEKGSFFKFKLLHLMS